MNDLSRQTLEAVHVGILTVDASGRVAYLNPAAEEILRGSSRALVGKHYRHVFRGSPEAGRVVRKALEEGTAVTAYDVELSAPFRGGGLPPAPVPVILGASPLAGEPGDPPRAVVWIKPAEILSLVGQEERAAMGAEELQTLAYGIAHEIKNPLGGILGAAQWMLRAETPAEERREGARLILREAGRINGLVEKMLEMGKAPPPPRPFPILPILSEAEELLRADARAQGKRIRFERDADPSLPDAIGHPEPTFRAIVNLLKNAVEAIPSEGTVRVTAQMNVNYRWGTGRGRRRSFLEITVTDDGQGMTPEALRKAAIPFFTTKPRGTGLGLVMARQAVSRQGGMFAIRSEPGKGTTVRLSLPVARAGGRRRR